MSKKALLLSLLTALISGISIFANGIFVTKTNPLVFTVLRNMAVVLLLTVGLILFGHAGKLKELRKRDWGKLIIIGAIGGGIPFALFFTGLAQIGAVNGNIIQKSLFLWVALLAVPLLKERLSAIHIGGYLALFVGMFAFSGAVFTLTKVGTWLILGATILWAIEHVFAKVTLQSVHPSVVAWGRMFFGLPFLFLAVVMTGTAGALISPNASMITPLIVSSVFLTAYVLVWYTAISEAPVTMVSSVLVLAPVITALLSFGILGKPFQPLQLGSYIFISLGVALVIAGEVVSNRFRKVV